MAQNNGSNHSAEIVSLGQCCISTSEEVTIHKSCYSTFSRQCASERIL